jgi:hypothetical protein
MLRSNATSHCKPNLRPSASNKNAVVLWRWQTELRAPPSSIVDSQNMIYRMLLYHITNIEDDRLFDNSYNSPLYERLL